MIIAETQLPGAFIVDVEPIEDERGFFARQWCDQEFASAGLSTTVSQASLAFNRAKGTLRGMHWQVAPFAEVKLVRCVRGAIYDVIVDLRLDSPTFLSWIGIELTAENRRSLYIPESFAHGYQTLEDETEVWYQMSAPYAPEAARGFRYDDSRFAIQWPRSDDPIISGRDLAWGEFSEGALAPLETPTAT